ncbi:hypothetical protein [Acrocarpospora sp. B8E8]|uniref:hypothetical protein n=1 Tax=Acrocarpospora sp. B8E8 TaxID=3153572 RepID=UPI00325EDB56
MTHHVDAQSVVVAVREFTDVPVVHLGVFGDALAEEIASFEFADGGTKVLGRDQMGIKVGPNAPSVLRGIGAVLPVVGAGQDDVGAAFEDGLVDCDVWEVGVGGDPLGVGLCDGGRPVVGGYP